MQLEVETGVVPGAPTEESIAEHLQWLVYPRNKFAILDDGERFTQAYLNDDGTYLVEYRDGSAQPIMRFEGATLEQATRVFQLFFRGGDYRGALAFQPFDLE